MVYAWCVGMKYHHAFVQHEKGLPRRLRSCQSCIITWRSSSARCFSPFWLGILCVAFQQMKITHTIKLFSNLNRIYHVRVMDTAILFYRPILWRFGQQHCSGEISPWWRHEYWWFKTCIRVRYTNLHRQILRKLFFYWIWIQYCSIRCVSLDSWWIQCIVARLQLLLRQRDKMEFIIREKQRENSS